MAESRIKKTLLNARVNLFFYFITLFVSFYSRKIFLEYLGVEFMGYSGTICSVLGFLNLADLGIGSSIGYVLYKPLYDKDHNKICEIISVFGYLYKIVGLIILAISVIFACFIPSFFPNLEFNYGVAYYTFFCFLIGNLFGYFINYRYTLLGADQKNYLVTIYFQAGNVLKTVVQVILVFYIRNLYTWATVELVFAIIYCFILNHKIKQVYPWLKTSIKMGKSKKNEYGIIMKKSKQLFVHKLAGTGRSQVLPLLIASFTSVSMVAIYTNYLLIVDKVTALLNNILASNGAGVGNLIAEGNKKNILKIFWELQAIRFYISGIIVFCMYNLLSPFISVWLGNEYLLSQTIVIVILVNLFMKLIRITNDEFIYGYGLYQDTWAPIVTLIITLAVSIVCGYKWGLAGVIAGDATSVILIIFTWKPIFLYMKGFKQPVMDYWKELTKYFIALAVSWSVSFGITKQLIWNPSDGYYNWIMYALAAFTVFSIIYAAILYLLCNGMRTFVQRVLSHFFTLKRRCDN